MTARWFPALLTLQHLYAITAQDSTISTNYRWFCDLTLNPVVTLEWDANIRGYAVQKQDEPDDNPRDPLSGWTRRLFGSDDDSSDYSQPLNLRSSANLPNFLNPEAALLAPNTTSRRELRMEELQPSLQSYGSGAGVIVDTALEPTTPAATVEARACDCWNSMVWGGAFYCTMPRTHCAIPSSPIGLPGCVDVQKQRRIVRSIWPVLVVWYASVLFCLSFTHTSRHAMSCCIATIYPGWNRATADRILRNDPNQANQMLLRHCRIMSARRERQLIRRHRRRARREQRRERQRQRNYENGANPLPLEEEDDSTDLGNDGDMPFPNVWDLGIIPRPAATSTSEPQPTTLTLKTRIYKQEDKDNIEDNIIMVKSEEENEAKNLGKETEDENKNHDEKDKNGLGDLDTPLAMEIDSNPEVSPPVDEIENQNSTSEEEKEETAEVSSWETPNDTTVAVDDAVANPPTSPAAAEDKEETIEESSEEAPNGTAAAANDAAANPATSPAAANNNLDLSEWDDHTCTICYMPLEDGDRVGALPCGHAFHVDPCLKHWLTRRNVCPLCLTENIATPNFARPPPRVEQAGNNNDDSMSDQDLSSDDQDDDNSSGILENDQRDPNLIPAFGVPETRTTTTTTNNRRPRSRIIEMTSIFTRRRRRNAEDGEPSGTTTSPEQFSNENGTS